MICSCPDGDGGYRAPRGNVVQGSVGMRNEGVDDTIRKVRVVVDLKGEFARGRRKWLKWDQDADGKKEIN